MKFNHKIGKILDVVLDYIGVQTEQDRFNLVYKGRELSKETTIKQLVDAHGLSQKNITSFKKYCGDPDKLNHFLNYIETKIFNLADFEFQYNFFVTPFLIYYPKNIVYQNPISATNIYLFNLQIKNLQKT